MYQKRISKTGQITIPKVVRLEQGIDRKTVLELKPLDNGDILLQKKTPSCFICGESEELVTLHQRMICKNCVKKALDLLGGSNESK